LSKIIGELADVPVPRHNLPESALLPVAYLLERVARWTGRSPRLPRQMGIGSAPADRRLKLAWVESIGGDAVSHVEV
jgi:hypothetical protein